MHQLSSSRLAHSRVACFRPITARSSRRLRPRVLAQQPGKQWSTEAETAAQVRRLIRRDKKEFLGADDILEKFEAEFGEGTAATQDTPTTSSPASAGATADDSLGAASTSTPPKSSLAAKAAAVAAAQSGAPARFTGAPTASPFGGPVTSSPFGSPAPANRNMEPQGLSPSMSPDPVTPEPKASIGSFISGITLTQIVIVLSFTTIIGLMVATFTFVYNVGAIKLAGVD